MKIIGFIKGEQLYKSKLLINNPIISIVLPTYCRGDNGLLKRSIDSVINQSFKAWELIIVDDGSVDSTQNLVKSYMELDNRIIYIRNEINSTLPALRVNQGLLHARGEYIAYQFDDDYWYENALQVLYKEIIQHDSLVLVYGAAKYINTVNNTESILGREFNRLIFEKGNIIPNNAVIHKKEILNIYGTYDCHKEMRRLCDWELWRRWSRKIPMIFINEVISVIETLHPKSLAMEYKMNILQAKKEKTNIYQILSLNNIQEYNIDE